MNGIIIVDKQAGMTSFDVVDMLKKITGERKIGHAGTLDPMATGVLPVFLGSSTKVISLLPCQDKRYQASFRLGCTTDTGDKTGRVLSRMPVNAGPEEVERVLRGLTGAVSQVPPMYSAVRYNGTHLYELARKGIEVERQPREIHIYQIIFQGCGPQPDEYAMEVFCSKGTYIRTLITDIGKKLGCGAVMTALRRTFAAGFSIDGAFTPGEIAEAAAGGELAGCVTETETPLKTFCEVRVTPKQAVRFRNGGPLAFNRLETPASGLCRVKSEGVLIGIGFADQEKQELRIQCLL